MGLAANGASVPICDYCENELEPGRLNDIWCLDCEWWWDANVTARSDCRCLQSTAAQPYTPPVPPPESSENRMNESDPDAAVTVVFEIPEWQVRKTVLAPVPAYPTQCTLKLSFD